MIIARTTTVCHLSGNYYMQAQCLQAMYVISNIHNSPLGHALLFSLMRVTEAWGVETELLFKGSAAMSSRAEIPTQVQTVMKPSSSLAASTVLNHGPPVHTALQKDWHSHRTSFTLHTHPQQGCRAFIIRPIFQGREPRAGESNL